MTYIFGNITYGTLYKASYNAYEVRVGYELINQSQEDNASIVNAILQGRTIDDTYQTWGYIFIFSSIILGYVLYFSRNFIQFSTDFFV